MTTVVGLLGKKGGKLPEGVRSVMEPIHPGLASLVYNNSNR